MHANVLMSWEKQGFLIMEGQALAWLPVNHRDEADYLGRLSGSRRKDLKRKLKKRSDVEVRILNGGDPFFHKPEMLELFYRLYLNVFKQSETISIYYQKNFSRHCCRTRQRAASSSPIIVTGN